jgi:hypothetical protein
MNSSGKYEQHRKTASALAHSQLQNCAMLCAYVFGSAPGWYAIVSGSINGFRSDYAMVHSNPGDFESHPVRAFYIEGNSTEAEYMADLDDIRRLVKKAHDMADLPLVATLTAEEKEAARLAVREALNEEQPKDAEEWLEELCDSGCSDLVGTDWEAVVAAVKK